MRHMHESGEGADSSHDLGWVSSPSWAPTWTSGVGVRVNLADTVKGEHGSSAESRALGHLLGPHDNLVGGFYSYPHFRGKQAEAGQG